MIIKIIDDMILETERFFAAGARLAIGDLRLKKNISVLETMGEKSPPLKKLAEKFTLLLNSDEENSGEALINAAELLYSVATVMCDTTIKGEEIAENGENSYMMQFHTGEVYHSEVKELDRLLNFSFVTNEIYIYEDMRFFERMLKKLKGSGQYAKLLLWIIVPQLGRDLIPFILDIIDEKPKPKGIANLAMALALSGYENADEYALPLLKSKDEYTLVVAFSILAKYPKYRDILKEKFIQIEYRSPEYRQFFISMLKILISDSEEILEHYKKNRNIVYNNYCKVFDNESFRYYHTMVIDDYKLFFGSKFAAYFCTSFVPHVEKDASKKLLAHIELIIAANIFRCNAVIDGSEEWLKILQEDKDYYGLCVYYINNAEKLVENYIEMLIENGGESTIPDTFLLRILNISDDNGREKFVDYALNRLKKEKNSQFIQSQITRFETLKGIVLNSKGNNSKWTMP